MQQSRFVSWIRAARPKTLPAAAIPVMIGGGLAQAGRTFILEPWLICLVFSLLIQIGTNFANDYYDFIKGADDDRRIGPSRAVASGWISPADMRMGMIVVFSAAFFAGCLLIHWGGIWLLIIGVLSITCGVAYTGGPYPLGYNGWGDVFVFIFFGWIATGFTYMVQAGTFTVTLAEADGAHWIWLAGIVPGALASNLLVVNNVRDAPLDKEAGKRTLVVRFGRSFGILEYSAFLLLSFLIPVAFALFAGSTGCLLVLLAAPLAWVAFRRLITASDRKSYDTALGMTALHLMIAGSLFALGLVF